MFLVGQRARVAVVAASPATVHLNMTDEMGAPQFRSDARSGCDWVPLWTTRFQIELVNAGATTAAYYVVVE